MQNELLLALAAAAGGTIGAVGTALLSWTQIRRSIDSLKQAADRARKGKAAMPNLLAAVDAHLRELRTFESALMTLRGALRIR